MCGTVDQIEQAKAHLFHGNKQISSCTPISTTLAIMGTYMIPVFGAKKQRYELDRLAYGPHLGNRGEVIYHVTPFWEYDKDSFINKYFSICRFNPKMKTPYLGIDWKFKYQEDEGLTRVALIHDFLYWCPKYQFYSKKYGTMPLSQQLGEPPPSYEKTMNY